MNHIRTLASLLAVAAASLLAGCAGVPDANEADGDPTTGEAASAFYGMARTPGGLLRVRVGPGIEYGIAYEVPNGRPLDISCYAIGSWDHGTNLWYRLWDGNFVNGMGVNAVPGIPRCHAFGFHGR